MTMKLRTFVSASLILILAACASPAPLAKKVNDRPLAEAVDATNADYGEYPTNYDELIRSWGSKNLKDAESARYGNISKPRKEYMFVNLKPFFGYSVCADINAKNSYGGYTGNQTFWFLIRDGKIERAQNTVGFPGRIISRGHKVNCEDGK